MPNKLFPILFFFLLFPSTGKSQDSHVDYLKTRLVALESGNKKVDFLMQIASAYQRSQPDSSFVFAQKALEMAEQISYSKGAAKAYSLMGDARWNQGEYKEAMDDFIRAFSIQSKLGDSLGIARSYTNIASVHWRYANYPEAMKYYMKGLDLRERHNDSAAMAHSFLSLGILQAELKSWEEAMFYYQKGLNLAKILSLKRMEATLHNHIGRAWRKQKIYDEARTSHAQSIQIFEELKDSVGLAKNYNNLGSIARRSGDFPEALEYFWTSLEMQKLRSDKEAMADGYNDIAKTNFQLEKYTKAIKYANKALSIAKEAGLRDDVRYAFETLSETYQAMGSYQKALDFHHEFDELADSLLDERKAEQIAQLQLLYESEDQQQQIEILKKDQALSKKDQALRNKNQRMAQLVVGAVALFLLLFVGFILRQNHIKNKTNKQLSEKNEIIEEERNRAEALLLNILPEEIADELKRDGKSQARNHQEVSVLFSDFSNFTQIAEKMGARELVQELDYCFRAFDKIIGKYGIEKIKTIGDAYMCAAGIPQVKATHALDMVAAGLDIQVFLDSYKKERIRENKPYFQARIGIHSGPVVSGIVGIKKFAYDIWGDTVNTASRMESSGRVGQINISSSTYALVKHRYSCIYRGKISAKGKGEVDMYFVNSPKAYSANS